MLLPVCTHKLLSLLLFIKDFSRHGFDGSRTIGDITFIVCIVELRLLFAAHCSELVCASLVLLRSMHAVLLILQLELVIERLAYTVILKL